MLLITTPNFTGDVVVIANAAEALGWSVHRATRGWRIPDWLKDQEGAVYGEQIFCEVVAAQMNWTLAQNDKAWLANLDREHTGRQILFTNVRLARTMQSPKFISPADYRSFAGAIYKSGRYLPPSVVIDDEPVLVSDVVNFDSEYRTFIKDRSVVAASCYVYNGRPAEKANWYYNTPLVIRYVNNLLSDEKIECVPGSVIDVGMFANGKMAVVKTKPAWKSAIHGCDYAAALDVIKDSVIN